MELSNLHVENPKPVQTKQRLQPMTTSMNHNIQNKTPGTN